MKYIWEAWCAAAHGVAKCQTRLSDWTIMKYMYKEFMTEVGCEGKFVVQICLVLWTSESFLLSLASDSFIQFYK